MKKLVGLFAVAMLAMACGSVADSDMDPSGDGDGDNDNNNDNDGPDVTAPSILSMSPEDGTAGARSDTVVVIEFSEAMDQLSVQNSIDTSDLGGVSFEWSEDGTTLFITPDQLLEYAEGEGNDPGAITPNYFAVTVGTGATDVAGNAVEVGAQTKFSTLKLISTVLGRDNALTAAGTHTGVITDADDYLYVGDDDAQGLAAGYRGYITMDLSELPQSAVEIFSAGLVGSQVAEINTPYDVLGDGTGVILDHGTFMLGDEPSENAAFNMEPLSEVGVFATPGDVSLLLNVTAQVRDDLAHRAERSDRSQYRLRFTEITNLDDTANYVLIGRDDLALKVIYLAP